MLKNDSSTSGTGRTSSTPRPILPQHARGERPATGHHRRHRAAISRTATATACWSLCRALLRQRRLRPAARSPRRSPRRRKELAYYHAYVGHGTEASITLAKMVLDRAPDHMSKVYFGLWRVGCQRDQHQAGLVLQQHPRPAREEEDHLALARLSRLGADDRVADRAGAVSQEIRPAAGAGPAHRGALLLPPRRSGA